MLINLVAVVFSDIFHLFDKNSIIEINIISFVSTLFMLIYFFFIPNFIYHPYFDLQNQNHEVMVRNKAPKTTSFKHVEKIEQYFNLHKSFLNPDYTITQLEKEIKKITKSLINNK